MIKAHVRAIINELNSKKPTQDDIDAIMLLRNKLQEDMRRDENDEMEALIGKHWADDGEKVNHRDKISFCGTNG